MGLGSRGVSIEELEKLLDNIDGWGIRFYYEQAHRLFIGSSEEEEGIPNKGATRRQVDYLCYTQRNSDIIKKLCEEPRFGFDWAGKFGDVELLCTLLLRFPEPDPNPIEDQLIDTGHSGISLTKVDKWHFSSLVLASLYEHKQIRTMLCESPYLRSPVERIQRYKYARLYWQFTRREGYCGGINITEFITDPLVKFYPLGGSVISHWSGRRAYYYDQGVYIDLYVTSRIGNLRQMLQTGQDTDHGHLLLWAAQRGNIIVLRELLDIGYTGSLLPFLSLMSPVHGHPAGNYVSCLRLLLENANVGDKVLRNLLTSDGLWELRDDGWMSDLMVIQICSFAGNLGEVTNGIWNVGRILMLARLQMMILFSRSFHNLSRLPDCCTAQIAQLLGPYNPWEIETFRRFLSTTKGKKLDNPGQIETSRRRFLSTTKGTKLGIAARRGANEYSLGGKKLPPPLPAPPPPLPPPPPGSTCSVL